MFKKNQQVKILPHTRTRHIFQGASVEPGSITHYKGGQIGQVRDILGDTGATSYVVELPGRTDLGNDFKEFFADELESA